MNTIKETREFMFPNGGHSVRKLSNALAELGDVMVSSKITETSVKFVQDNEYGRMNALLLAKKVLLLGTRFTVLPQGSYPNVYYTIQFHTEFDDIEANPVEYGVKETL